MTGLFLLSRNAGVKIFRNKQSSLIFSPPRAPCGEDGPYSTASKTPFHFSGGSGGIKRLLEVSAPYHTPLKTLMPSSVYPRTCPYLVVAMGDSALNVVDGMKGFPTKL